MAERESNSTTQLANSEINDFLQLRDRLMADMNARERKSSLGLIILFTVLIGQLFYFGTYFIRADEKASSNFDEIRRDVAELQEIYRDQQKLLDNIGEANIGLIQMPPAAEPQDNAILERPKVNPEMPVDLGASSRSPDETPVPPVLEKLEPASLPDLFSSGSRQNEGPIGDRAPTQQLPVEQVSKPAQRPLGCSQGLISRFTNTAFVENLPIGMDRADIYERLSALLQNCRSVLSREERSGLEANRARLLE
ncbi:hypothetical protein V5T82_16820 [Magnetovibrio sp. PR-2]|uniref:hypothetical protein n=1 Tax=Magnetovibrio sp. PR-2 TaxID=3120356 RepID=UPI002FCE444D